MDAPIPKGDLGRGIQRAFGQESMSNDELAERVLARGFLTPSQVRSAVEDLRARGGEARLEQILLQKRYLTAEQLVELLEEPAEGCAGKSVGRYRLVRQVGRGGMGTVYEAEDPRLKRQVALKIIREDEGTAAVIARLHREAAIMAQLRHPNIVGVHEVGMERDESGQALHFIAMDYVPGRTFEGVLADPAVGLDEKLRMLQEVARAVAYAHSQGVLHRDLKPGNVLVETTGRVLLTDFGLARAREFATRLTRSAEVMGTPVYMAPEQVEGKTREIDERTDVYALGVILYEILANRAPFQGRTPEKLYHQIVHDDPIRPSRFRKEVARDLEVLCLKALEKSRGRRYPSAAEFADELARSRRGEPIQARPPSLFYRVRKRIARRKSLFAAATAAILLTAATLLGWDALRTKGQVRELLGQAAAAEKVGQIEEARDTYRRVLDQKENHPIALAGWRRTSEAIERRSLEAAAKAEAREEALRLLEKGRGALTRARACLYEGTATYSDLSRAVKESQEFLERALAAYPDLALVHYLTGQSWEMIGEFGRAESSYRTALEIDPKLTPARLHLGRLLLHQSWLACYGSKDQDPTRLLRAATLFADEGLSLIETAAAERSGLDDELQRKLAAVTLTYARMEVPQLREQLEEAIRTFGERPGTEEFYLLLSYFEPDPERRVAALETALRIRPKFPLALFRRGETRDLDGDFEGAVRDYSDALQAYPNFYWAYNHRGITYRTQRKYDAALRDFTRAIEIDSRHVQPYHNRGLSYLEMGDVDSGLRDLDHAIEMAPHYSELYTSRGNGYVMKEEWEPAIRDASKALELEPEDGRAWWVRAMANNGRGSYDAAISDFTHLIRSKFETAQAYVGRGMAYQALHKLDLAIADFTQAIALEPTDFQHRLTRGLAYEAARDWDAAIRDYTTAIERKPDWGTPY